MFEREHHRRIARLLEALDADLLLANRCLFGGGTAIALRHGEFHESVDVDFLVSDRGGFRALRQRVTSGVGLNGITRRPGAIEQSREWRADQYGLRTRARVEGSEIKLEIVLEARIDLEPPGAKDRVCGVATLTELDLATSKLLANSDRWTDDSVFSRDLIDLAMMRPSKSLVQAAREKAALAYGASIERDLYKAIERLRERPGRLEQCRRALQMTDLSAAEIWSRIRKLLPRPAGVGG